MKVYPTPILVRTDLQAHISSRALMNNLRNLRGLCRRGTRFCAVVKANAYGHGIREVVEVLRLTDVDFYAVCSIHEAIHISELVRGKPILILEPMHTAEPADFIPACADSQFHRVATSLEAVDCAAGRLRGSDKILNLHVNLETGMGRCGIEPELAVRLIQRIRQEPNLRLAGIYTHFATADEEDLSYAREQLKRFNRFLAEQQLLGKPDLIVHSANSAATIKLKDAHFDMVRCGISLYGYFSRRMSPPPIHLEPAMRLEAPIVQLKTLPAGHSVSYGRSFVTTRPTVVGMLPLGYADGYWRCFSNCAVMKIGSTVVPVIGRVCMDQILIDVTDVPDAHVGQMATVIDDRHNSPCGVYALADLAQTICYEILTSVHAHVNRIVH